MIPVNPDAVIEFVPESEKGAEQPTTFLIRPLTVAEDEYVQTQIGGMTADAEGNFHLSAKTAQRSRLILNLGLVG